MKLNFNHIKIALITLLTGILVAYTNCGRPFGTPSELVFQSNVYGGGSGVSYEAFKATVYPITRSYCVSCHSETQPQHAADEYHVAHDAVISQFKVNFANIPASRLVAKLRDDNHNCWSDCVQNAQEMQTAIEDWNDAIKDSGVDTTPADTNIYTAESDTIETELADPLNPMKSNSVKLTIEAAMLRAPMVLTKPTGNEAYLSVPNNGTNTTLTGTDATAGIAYFNFTVPASGSYRLWGLFYGPADADNSFFVDIKNATTQASVVGGMKQWEPAVNTRFEWKQVPNINPTLNPNVNYTVELRQRENGSQLAGLIITSDPNFNGSEIGDFFGKTLAWDLSGILKTPGVTFTIDLVDYDPYSYKVSRPRIISGGSNIAAKDLRILVNGVYSPQHSTYTIVDKTVTATDPSLSGYSMILLKDKGPAFDRLKVSFAKLSVNVPTSTTGGTGGGTTTGGTGTMTSLMAFQNTMYPISRSSVYGCVNCHRSVSPQHASDNAQTAHDAALTVVDFTNPANSRIVNKMKNLRHNCGANCDALATQYQQAITDWKTNRQ